MANDFSFDSSCVALYRFEASNILADSKGSNTLSNSGPAAADTSVYQEGAASCQFDTWDYLSRANGDLSNDFPGKNGTTNKDITVCVWIYSHSGGYGSKGPIFSIYQYADYSGLIFLHENNATLDCVIGYGTGAESHARGYTFELDTWYHVSCRWNNSTKVASFRIWDGPSATNVSYTYTNALTVGAAPFKIAESQRYLSGSDTYNFEGKMDEYVVFNRVLSDDEIDEIREGTYGGPSSSPSASVSRTPSASVSASPSSSTSAAPIPSYGELLDRPIFPITERLSWLTRIVQSGDRSEQRLCMRLVPRQSFDLKIPVRTDADHARLECLLHNRLKEDWVIPIWPEQVYHAGAIAAGAGSITCSTAYADFRNGGLAVIWQSNTLAEYVTIDTVSAGSFTIDGTVANAYSGPCWVMPARIGYITRTCTKDRRQTGVGFLTLTAEITDNAAVTGHAAGTTVDGYEVRSSGYMPEGSMVELHDPDITLVDGETGAFEIVSTGSFNVVSRTRQYVNTSKAEAWSFRQWLHQLYGRQKAFLAPTLRRDFELSRSAGASDTQLYVANRGYASEMGFNALRTYVSLRPEGGTLVTRKLTNIGWFSAGEECIILASGAGVELGTDALVCWTDRVRLGSDTIELQWIKPGMNICTVDLVGVTA